jgi:hypothetical protein
VACTSIARRFSMTTHKALLWVRVALGNAVACTSIPKDLLRHRHTQGIAHGSRRELTGGAVAWTSIARRFVIATRCAQVPRSGRPQGPAALAVGHLVA